MLRKSFLSMLFLSFIFLIGAGMAQAKKTTAAAPNAVGTAFTYQGQLKDTNGPVTGKCDFHFGLWDAISGGTQVSATLEQPNIAVSEGLFVAQLDFGVNAFDGNPRWIEIAVLCPAGSGSFTTLAPRQPLSPAPYALYSANADTLDGLHADAFQQHYQNLVVVAKSGGDFTTITTALDSITTNSVDNPFTIYVAPGVYTETVTMKPYVDIEGAGETATRITHAGWVSSTLGTVMGADNAELRFLAVENTGGADCATAIYNDHASPRITHVTAVAFAGVINSIGVDNEYADPTLTDVTASGSGAAFNVGMYNYFSSPIMTNVTVAAFSGETSLNYGVSNQNGSPTMNYVIVNASGGMINYGVSNSNASPTMNNVTVSASGGTSSYGVYNDHNSWPTMSNMTASASGGEENYGVRNEDSSSPTMINVAVTVVGGTHGYGVHNMSSSPSMTNVVVTVSGGTNNYGVWNDSSSIRIKNSLISASGGAVNDGLHSIAMTDAYTVEIDGSQIAGSTSTIYQNSQYTTRIGASQLSGAGAFGGAYACVASYDENYTALNSSCQP